MILCRLILFFVLKWMMLWSPEDFDIYYNEHALGGYSFHEVVPISYFLDLLWVAVYVSCVWQCFLAHHDHDFLQRMAILISSCWICNPRRRILHANRGIYNEFETYFDLFFCLNSVTGWYRTLLDVVLHVFV